MFSNSVISLDNIVRSFSLEFIDSKLEIQFRQECKKKGDYWQIVILNLLLICLFLLLVFSSYAGKLSLMHLSLVIATAVPRICIESPYWRPWIMQTYLFGLTLAIMKLMENLENNSDRIIFLGEGLVIQRSIAFVLSGYDWRSFALYVVLVSHLYTINFIFRMQFYLVGKFIT